MSQLFTFVLDVDGGTYITQLSGTLEDVCEKWVSAGMSDLDGIEDADVKELQESFAQDEMILLNGMKNVWCLSGLLKDRLALVHIVQTETSEIQNPKSKIQN